MKVSVIIPTLNSEQWISQQLDMLLSQSVEAEILVIDSDSTDLTTAVVAAYGERVRLLQIPQSDFDHGGTRDYALRQSRGDCVLFLTQDALPTNERYIENLLRPFADKRIAAAFGRQIARPDAPEYERLTRQFNYPDQPRVWEAKDISRYGVKAYFFSDACSAYRREAYFEVGGFDAPILTNEDMMMAAKLLHAGYALAYAPEASVYHSHRYSLRTEYRRNVKIGTVMEQYRDRLTGAHPDAEGWRLLHYVCGELVRHGRVGEVLVFSAHAAARLTGNLVGKLRGRRRRA